MENNTRDNIGTFILFGIFGVVILVVILIMANTHREPEPPWAGLTQEQYKECLKNEIDRRNRERATEEWKENNRGRR